VKLFIDTANVAEISEAASWGILDGDTTNPSLVAREGRSYHDLVAEICRLVPGPVSAEVLATDAEGMEREGRELAGIAENVVVKLPITQDGMQLVREIVQIYDAYEFPTQVLVASVRHPQHVVEGALAGADVATVPFKVLQLLFHHPLTDIGLQRFISDFREAKDVH